MHFRLEYIKGNLKGVVKDYLTIEDKDYLASCDKESAIKLYDTKIDNPIYIWKPMSTLGKDTTTSLTTFAKNKYSVVYTNVASDNEIHIEENMIMLDGYKRN